MLDTEEIQRVRYEIETLGFSIVEGIVDAAARQRIKTDLKGALAADSQSYGGLPNKTDDLVNNLAIYGGSLLELLDNNRMRQVFDLFLGESCVLYNYSSTILEPGGTPGASNIHVDTPRLVPGHHLGLIMTLALDDFTPDNGATHYLPGSQNVAQIPTAEVFHKYAVSVARPAGAAVFFNPRCFHKATANNTGVTRDGVTVYATRVYMKPRFDYPRMLKPAIVDQASPRLRQFLGFDARVPADMAEFHVEESRRLYKGGQG